MHETGYAPGDDLRSRIAPTERRYDAWLIGRVHDPRAAVLGGVAGHAGLFSSAGDLAIYADALLRRGESPSAERRLLKPTTFDVWLKPREVRLAPLKRVDDAKPPAVRTALRTYGWDNASPYSSNRGKSLSPAAFGHGGFTGTSLWIDPDQDLFVIFLSNRLHPDGKGSVNPLAGELADIAVAALRDRKPATVSE
ncbi:MAG: serine hydrolase [Pirellulales bacterium]